MDTLICNPFAKESLRRSVSGHSVTALLQAFAANKIRSVDKINTSSLFNKARDINRGSNPPFTFPHYFNEARGIRTPDNLIKSQVLY
ncbi:MAG: hypothetical protein LUI12_01010, partial [Clostridiales bacterium]|nr:hypothetical protein [Clostridiales bacterium]